MIQVNLSLGWKGNGDTNLQVLKHYLPKGWVQLTQTLKFISKPRARPSLLLIEIGIPICQPNWDGRVIWGLVPLASGTRAKAHSIQGGAP